MMIIKANHIWPHQHIVDSVALADVAVDKVVTWEELPRSNISRKSEFRKLCSFKNKLAPLLQKL